MDDDRKEVKATLKRGAKLFMEHYDFIEGFCRRLDRLEISAGNINEKRTEERKEMKRLETKVDELHAALEVAVNIIDKLQDIVVKLQDRIKYG